MALQRWSIDRWAFTGRRRQAPQVKDPEMFTGKPGAEMNASKTAIEIRIAKRVFQ